MHKLVEHIAMFYSSNCFWYLSCGSPDLSHQSKQRMLLISCVFHLSLIQEIVWNRNANIHIFFTKSIRWHNFVSVGRRNRWNKQSHSRGNYIPYNNELYPQSTQICTTTLKSLWYTCNMSSKFQPFIPMFCSPDFYQYPSGWERVKPNKLYDIWRCRTRFYRCNTPYQWFWEADTAIAMGDWSGNFLFQIFILFRRWFVDNFQAIIELQTGIQQRTPLEWPFSQETNEEQATKTRLSKSILFFFA